MAGPGAGCAHHPAAGNAGAGSAERQDGAPKAELEEARLLDEVRRSLETRRGGITSLRGRGYLWITSPQWEGAGRVNTIILARRPDELRMRGLLPFSTVFDVVSGPQRFYLHFPGPAEVWTGPPEELAHLTGLPIVPRDVIAAVFAAPFVEPTGVELSSYDHTTVWVEWPFQDGVRIKGRFARDPVLPREFAVLEGGELKLRLEYGDYLLEPDGWWPRDITLRWPELETRMRISFVEIELNPKFKPGSFEFAAPDGVEWFEAQATEAGRADAAPYEGEQP
jgi:hypothetical protein